MESELRESLAGAQVLGRWTATLPAPLEQRFIHETDTERDCQVGFWVGCGLAFTWLTFICDLVTVPDAWLVSFLLKLCVATPLALIAMRTLAHPGPRWRKAIATIAPQSVSILIVMVIFGVSANTDTFRSAIVLSLGVLWINVVVPMRLRDTVIFSAVTLAVGDLINVSAAYLQNAPFAHADVVLCTQFLVALSVLARFLGERQSRRSFVLGLRLQIKADDLARSNARLLKMSHTDPLTGLANRRSFDLAFAQAHTDARATRSPLAVMMIDVDHFKLFNDAAGHLEGDRCLTVIARTIAEQVRGDQDLAARFGGEEFVVLMPSTDLATAKDVAARIHTAIAALRVFHPARPGYGFVSVSIGLAGTDSSAAMSTDAELLRAADEALYAAKRAGRDRVVCAGGEMIGAAV